MENVNECLRQEEAAELLGISQRALEAGRLRRDPGYPPAIKIGRCVRYRRSTLERWLEQREAATAQALGAGR